MNLDIYGVLTRTIILVLFYLVLYYKSEIRQKEQDIEDLKKDIK